MKKTLLFYDIETTGLNKCFDQVLQFAAIRTDTNLNEIERHEIDICLNCDVVPAPQAIMTHEIGLQRIQQGEKEIDAIQKIHALLNSPGTISLGYNTLGFDDEFLRFSFYRNLLTPYTHQFASGCSRMDIYPLTVLYYLFKPDLLEWPSIDGKISLKLDNLNQANNLAKGQAHDAMVDVEVTLALAKKLMSDQKTWDYTCDYFDKRIDLQRSNDLPIIFENEDELIREALLVQGKFGPNNNFIAPVLSLGQHRHYKNQTLWLKLDEEGLLQANKDNFIDNTYVIRKKMGEQEFLLPPQRRFKERISIERQMIAEENKQRLLDQPKLLNEISDYYRDFKYPPVPHIDIDAALYEIGFPSAAEEKLFRDFHRAKPEAKYNIAQRFPNSKRREQAMRILTRHYPECIDVSEKVAALEAMADTQAQDYRGQTRLTAEQSIQEIDKLSKGDLTVKQTELLDELKAYLEKKSTVITT